jgi:hypothetical protein
MPNPHHRAETRPKAAFLHPKGVIIGREKGVVFGCDLTLKRYGKHRSVTRLSVKPTEKPRQCVGLFCVKTARIVGALYNTFGAYNHRNHRKRY